MSIIYPNGAGETLGNQLVTCRPLYSVGSLWYVNSSGGIDAASPAGKNREKPLATLNQAITNAVAGDIIVLMAGHQELNPTTSFNINKSLIIVGAGSSGGKPTVKLRANALGNVAVAAANVQLRNIWFPASPASPSAPNVAVAGGATDGFQMKDCYFELAQFDSVGLQLASNTNRVVNTTFISTSLTVTTQPGTALNVNAAVSDLELDGVTFSAGTVGFSNPAAFTSGGNVLTRLRAENVSLLLGADIAIAAGSTGYLNPQLATGGSRVDF